MIDASDILAVLETLVACDTRNPPRAIVAEDPVFDFVRSRLGGFEVTITDHGNGSLGLLARRGTPATVFNFHLDTVPESGGWSRDPLRLHVEGDRAIGLGACDIKGALACMLAVATHSEEGDLAILVTTDEEAGDSRAVARFLGTDHGFSVAIVAEPTLCRAVCAHRGIATARVSFLGRAGHASAARAITDSAVHRSIVWGERCLETAAAWAGHAVEGLEGVPFNIGRIEGGTKPNMIADSCEVSIGLRPLPGQDGEALIRELVALAPEEHLEGWTPLFSGPPLPSAKRGEAALDSARERAGELGLGLGEAVDYWSEAALFSEAGLDALVLGSGDIAQAHAADEWVAVAQLVELARIYERLIADGN